MAKARGCYFYFPWDLIYASKGAEGVIGGLVAEFEPDDAQFKTIVHVARSYLGSHQRLQSTIGSVKVIKFILRHSIIF